MKIALYILVFTALSMSLASCSKEDRPPDPVTDIDGNTYKTVRIGTQIWMAENLKTTTFSDGSVIRQITGKSVWDTLSLPGYCWYNNDETAYKASYGALYNGYTITDGMICPTGWHVPAAEEWQLLITFLGDSIKAGGKLKESGTDHWLIPNTGADNSSGFGAVAAGIRYFEGSFSSVSYFTSFWSSTQIGTDDKWYMSLYYGDAKASLGHKSKNYGFSVRCVKD
jgi:uncharacterized protein (TIGR02145 family)